MKRTIKLSAWGVLIILANQLNAATVLDSSFDVIVNDSKSFELSLENLKGDIKVSLLDSKDDVLYTERFATSTGSFKKTFDMSLFPDGNYHIELFDSEKMQSLPISIEDNKLTVDVLKKSVYFLPVINKRNKIVRVNMPALDEEYLDISILNSMNEVIYKAKLRGKDNIGKVFDFSSTSKGVYEILLISKAGFVSKEIVID